MLSNRNPLDPARTADSDVRVHITVFFVLLLVWFTINLTQAWFMEILGDEAYYKLYSENLDWGYYDHPPMIALMVRISSIFFTGNMGIRFFTVVLQPFTLLLIWMTIDKEKNDRQKLYTFFIIAGSVFMFTGYGVITSPDAPLLFFTALFLYAYKRFTNSPAWPVTLLLGFAMAALVYSKYQAVLVIGFAVMSNMNLLRHSRFRIAALLALLLIIPHGYWQFSHDFPSLQYHLSYRLENFQIKNVLEYLPNQMILLNPFTMGAAAFALIKFAPADTYNRGLYTQIIGFFVFFLFISFRDHVEPNWTIPCAIPVIIMLTERISKNHALFKYSRRIILPSIVLVLVSRTILMSSNEIARSIGYDGKKGKYELIETVAKELPVVFLGSYQSPSLYHFFTGKQGIVLSSFYSRQTQFDIWQFEKRYNNKRVFISSVNDKRSRIYRKGPAVFHGFIADSLQTVNRMKIKYTLENKNFHAFDSVKINFRIKNTYDFPINFNHRDFPVKVCLVLTGKYKKDIHILDVSLSNTISIIDSGQESAGKLSAAMPDLPPGKYKLAVCLNNAFGPAFNSRFSEIHIAEK